MIWSAVVKLAGSVLKALGLLFVYQSGRTSAENDQLEDANKELEKNAEIDSKPVSRDDAYDGLHNFGQQKRDSRDR